MSGMTMARQGAARSTTFRQELADCWRFLRRPTLSGRLPGRRAGSGWASDWRPGVGTARLLAWAAVLWALNLFALGPIAVTVAGAGGAMHRLDPANIPWLTAILWAPLVEELLFRYGLRRPAQALWFCPMVLPAILWGAQGWTLALVAVAVWLAWLSLRRGRASLAGWDTTWRRYYSYRFGLVFHLVALTFAAVHLNNFSLSQTPVWLLPLLVLPQWATGLVLGWMRVRRGIGAAIALHALFNGGPVLMIWLLMTLMPAGA
ncbi:type II CAAX prenyl endopeptidase Rce1 family protein [Bordetella bronchiseptica]|uniref:CPBP family glutamic-type intramembrane protease n=1 Tax=Bordetella bronchiseptica TaxID=518 RepID=UPI000B9AEB87|nr:CPBP family glutamic-type intramembrane protease [Bordetella bronchiseptica]AZW42758.1 CPBP family intramembrane metalloprotease [Bordetella bronchiseptica]